MSQPNVHTDDEPESVYDDSCDGTDPTAEENADVTNAEESAYDKEEDVVDYQIICNIVNHRLAPEKRREWRRWLRRQKSVYRFYTYTDDIVRIRPMKYVHGTGAVRRGTIPLDDWAPRRIATLRRLERAHRGDLEVLRKCVCFGLSLMDREHLPPMRAFCDRFDLTYLVASLDAPEASVFGVPSRAVVEPGTD